MQKEQSGRIICGILAVVNALYLASGMLNILQGEHLARITAAAYFFCFLLGLLAVLAAFMLPGKIFRALAILSMAPIVPVVGTDNWQIIFFGIINLPISFYVSFGSGRIFAGVNIVPAVLLALIIAYGNKLVKKTVVA